MEILENNTIAKTHINYDRKMLELILAFLKKIDIQVIDKRLNSACLLPGLDIYKNTILLDRTLLKYPGDLLHEAGHLAVTPKENRPLIGTKNMVSNWPTEGDEIAAILWSYAAAVHLKIPLEVVFHPNGYKQDSNWLIQQFTSKNYIGLPLLTWMGFLDPPATNMDTTFPKLKKWLR